MFSAWGNSWGRSWGGSWGFSDAPAQTTSQGGALGWYYKSPLEKKQAKTEEFEKEFIEALEVVNLQENVVSARPEFERQKQIIAQNILRKIDAIDILQSAEIQAMIIEAEFKYYQRLAQLRELDDETALMLLLN